MPIEDAVAPVQKVTIEEMAPDFANQFSIVGFETPGVETDEKIAVTLQLKNPLNENLAVKERIRLTCTAGATMSLADAGNGAVLAGDNSEDIIIETDETTGTFDLEVATVDVGTITVVGGVTQGSGFVACGETLDLIFA